MKSVRVAAASAVAALAVTWVGGTPAGASVVPSLPGAPTSSLCPTPTITSVATATGQQAAPPQATVYVDGTNFNAGGCATSLRLGGQGVTVTVDSPTQLHFAMPAGNPGGAVQVTLTDFLGDTATDTGTFDFVALPTVSSLSSRTPVEGQSIQATGTGFSLAGLPDATVTVSYCGAPAQPAQIVNDTSVAGPGPASYCNGPATLSFSTPHLVVAVAAGAVTVAARITSISPAGAVAPGSTLTVSGSGFGPTGTASVSGVSAAIENWSDASVALVVPAGVASGQVALNRNDGTSAGRFALDVAPASSTASGTGPGAVAGGPSSTTSGASAGGTGPAAASPTAVVNPGPQAVNDALNGVATAASDASPAGTSASFAQSGIGPITIAPGTPEAVAIAEGATGYSQTGGSAGRLEQSSPAMPAVVSQALSAVAPHPLPMPWMIASILLLTLVAAVYLIVVRQGGTGALILPPIQAPKAFWRLAGAAGAALLVAAYIVTAVSVLLTLLTYWLPGSGGATLPGAGLYKVTAILLSVVLTGIAGRYVYYYYCWIRSRHDFAHARPVDVEALRAKPIPYLKFQVTTRGGALSIVERTVQHVIDVAEAHPWLASKMSVEVITESMDEAGHLPVHFHDAPIQVSAVCLPRNYQTPNGTGLKARALHYLVERRLEGWNRKPGRTFIVHLDEETLVTVDHTLVLVEYLAGDPRPVSQGPILYPMEWDKAPWLCRAMESLRPFGCSECARVMSNPPPPHLHGSNLVIDEDVENRIGWDFGTVDGEPYIAEDLLFGLRAFALLGKEGFGWHGATMLEQPPLSVYWAVQQRLRWVLGALQGWRAMGTRDDLLSIPVKDRARLRRAVGYRIATYSLGFPVGFAGLYFLVHHPSRSFAGLFLFIHHPWQELASIRFEGIWRLAITVAGLGWVFSYQIGLARNLRYQELGLMARARQHLTIFVLTPVTGMFETAGPFLALTRWLLGHRQAKWTPTPKTAQAPAAAPAAVTVPAFAGPIGAGVTA